MLSPAALTPLRDALAAAGVPAEFAVVPRHQVVPAAVCDAIVEFIRVFDAVTTRPAWQAAAQRDSPGIARQPRREVCFFSAWDFHLSPDGGCLLIEFNDNGSGLLLSAIINAAYWRAAGLDPAGPLIPPPDAERSEDRVAGMVAAEAGAFFGGQPDGALLVLDDADSLRGGRFRSEFALLRDMARRHGWQAAIGAPEQLAWDGSDLLFEGRNVAFVVNRSTDFFWQAASFAALREAYAAGTVYVAPNPFTYATRSDKRLLELLSLPYWDDAVGINREERAVLSKHVPETHVVRPDNVDMLAEQKHEFVFKPLHGFAGRGLLDSSAVGRERLRRLAAQGPGYVAQRLVAKPAMQVAGQTLWSDLRVWAYRGAICNLSGRGSTRPDRLALAPPGGWLPTYASRRQA